MNELTATPEGLFTLRVSDVSAMSLAVSLSLIACRFLISTAGDGFGLWIPTRIPVLCRIFPLVRIRTLIPWLKYSTRMHSSRMCTARSLIVSPYLIVSHAPAQSNHACPLAATMHPPEQPRMPPPRATMHAPPGQPCMPPLEQPCMPPGATMHAPLRSNHTHTPEQPHTPRSNHTCPHCEQNHTHL